jgi:hypothetical protein
MRSGVPISSSMRRTASLAPPCAGPHREAMPAAMHANGLAWEEEAMRTVDVLAFCSWSACRMKIVSSAAAWTGLTVNSSHGVANIMWRKLAAQVRDLRGYTDGSPMAVLYLRARRGAPSGGGGNEGGQGDRGTRGTGVAVRASTRTASSLTRSRRWSASSRRGAS